ncbi:Vacuolar protein sorting-associated protein 8 [Taxawa tesnikishii (nom. ined.)]|nr:Vacuolar protein sorting-associated protein 8 [Dothideales sp. JES 119]
MLTPYLLVIVSTTPIAQTQHKSPRPKEITPHSALSGCLAWFPAVKLKTATAGKDVSETKLVYCWSNVLTVLEVESRPQDGQSEKDKLPNLFFHPRRRWKCEEAIVAVQWLSRSVIGVLTISQRLVILEDGALHVMESVDLLQKHIYHQNVFSDQLHVVVEQTENESAMHGVVADAFFMSFRVYKGRLFLLGFNDVAVGTMSNWADRLTALVEHGDDVSAIRLAINYYVGEVGRVAVGLPEDDAARHALVQGRLLELISASLRYTFSQAAQRDPDRLKDLAIACFAACITIDDQSFLFDEVYDAYKDSGEQAVILELLETDILEGEITALPPPVVKDLVDRFMELRQSSRLEELLCRLDPRAFDIDQITRLCKQHNLYDALIFVWNEALLDFVTPLVDLLALVKELKMSAYNEETPDESIIESARKIFAYLAYSLTGRLYPKDEPIDEQDADRVKTDIYRFLFSHQILPWPPGSTSKVRTEAESVDEPPFPYLRLLLQYDSASFMSMLNEAFEDPFLNGVQEDEFDGLASQLNGTTRRGNSSMTRQHIIGILLDIMSDEEFAPEQTIYLDMFIARSLPKYPQFMILSGSALQQVLDRLCTFPSEDLANDCQLSVEYLLSVYHPPVTPELIQLLHDARFYRVLKSQYRSQHQCVYLLQTYFIDPDDKSSIFEDVVQCLRNDVTSRQAPDIKALLCQHAQDLAAIDLPETVRTTLLEPSLLHYHGEPPTARAASDEMITKFGEQYVQLMCIHDPKHVADYIGLLKSGDLRLDEVIPAMEENGIIDAAVLLLAQDGLARDAMDRSNSDFIKNEGPRHRTNAVWDVKEDDLDLDEFLWLNLLDAVVSVAKEAGSEIAQLPLHVETIDGEKINNGLRSTVQQTFTALLATTASSDGKPEQDPSAGRRMTPSRIQNHQSFLRVFRAFLTRATLTAPSLSDLRAVLLDIFSAYNYESGVLSLANQLLGRDVFGDVDEARQLRQRGWRPRTQVCEQCKRRAWGPGVGESVWDEWTKTEQERLVDKRKRAAANIPNDDAAGRGKGKANDTTGTFRSEEELEGKRKLALIVFACRHVCHRVCLEGLGRREAAEEGGGGFRCPVCVPDA